MNNAIIEKIFRNISLEFCHYPANIVLTPDNVNNILDNADIDFTLKTKILTIIEDFEREDNNNAKSNDNL